MYDDFDDELFGHDGRHRPLPSVALPAGGWRIRHKHAFKSLHIRELEPFEDLFDAPVTLGEYDMKLNCAWRFMLPTWNMGNIEADVFRENILLLPEPQHRREVYEKLNKAGYYYQIVGDNEFIYIKKN